MVAMKLSLRIAVSVFFALMAVAICVLWVRTRHTLYAVGWEWSSGNYVVVTPCTGEIGFEFAHLKTSTGSARFQVYSFALDKEQRRSQLRNFQLTKTPTGIRGGIPLWFLVATSAILAVIPWVRWRFSLRTMLIATTLFAVGLGLVCYIVR